MKKEYSIRCNFKNNELICNDIIKLVANDFNNCIFKFNFEEELSNMKVLFKLKKQNSDFYWIKEVIDNQVEIVDFDEGNNPLIVIKEPGIYEFELSLYDENSKLTNYAILKDIRVREELVKQSDVDNYVSSSEKMPVLDQLIKENVSIANEEKKRVVAEKSRVEEENKRVESENKREEYIKDLKQEKEEGKLNGATFTPEVDSEGNLSWTNNKELSNPETVNIKGPKGDKGDCNFATFDIDLETGELVMHKTENMLLDFKINENGELVVII